MCCDFLVSYLGLMLISSIRMEAWHVHYWPSYSIGTIVENIQSTYNYFAYSANHLYCMSTVCRRLYVPPACFEIAWTNLVLQVLSEIVSANSKGIFSWKIKINISVEHTGTGPEMNNFCNTDLAARAVPWPGCRDVQYYQLEFSTCDAYTDKTEVPAGILAVISYWNAETSSWKRSELW